MNWDSAFVQQWLIENGYMTHYTIGEMDIYVLTPKGLEYIEHLQDMLKDEGKGQYEH